jgi:hypothetical protein
MTHGLAPAPGGCLIAGSGLVCQRSRPRKALFQTEAHANASKESHRAAHRTASAAPVYKTQVFLEPRR